MKVSYKRWIVAGFSILVLFSVLCVYIFIPAELKISNIQLVKCNPNGAFRNISEEAKWRVWYPREEGRGYSYRLGGKFFREVGVSLEKGTVSIPGSVSVIPLGNADSMALQWKCQLRSAGMNPLKRVLYYRQAVRVSELMSLVLARMKLFLEKRENVYGMDVKEGMSRDSSLAVIKWSGNSYPTTAELYQTIKKIRTYISSQGRHETDPPMMRIRHLPGGGYESMVGLPIDRSIMGSGEIQPARFVPWKVLMGEVRGGAVTAELALEQLQFYVEDHQRTGMALSFQSLVTERDQEKDTTRWVTRVMLPVP